ncbi:MULTISPECIES: class I adenylate-forming enzyme family protein [Burkholderia]|nr:MULTISPECIES: AMP-binding protein [Burkholderia]KML19801.1 long-chain fatty acid--CoA ligase [Burkholderia cepacia]KMN59644.1 long-chain fatty acid--CoA ligase [Burkholderia sp. LK4]MDN7855366.1 AMP-binding protein [Burkholderia cepacia]NTX49038.1 AMP-binding protein [Burkholderia cepacia]QFS42115.1 AMP-binding enzym [Burkholderia cepacia]
MKMNFCRIMCLMTLRFRDRQAIVNVERSRSYSYHEYHLLTNRIADALRNALGVGKGDKFLLILENDNLSLMMLPTVLKQEGTVVMTNLRDAPEEHARQIELVKPKVVFIETRMLDGYYDMLRAAGCEIVVMDNPTPEQAARPGVRAFWHLVDAASELDADVELDDDEHICMLRFTGGTTGQGKCAMYSIDNLMACCDGGFRNPDFGFNDRTRMLHVAPLSHGAVVAFILTFYAGGANITLNQLDLEQWRETAEQQCVTHSFLVPTVLYRLLELQRTNPRNLSSLNTLIYAAAPMSPAKLDDLITCFGPIFAQAYAATEVPMFVSTLDKAEHETAHTTGSGTKRLSSAGRTTPGVEVYITDEQGNPLPTGQCGEIRIRSRAVIKGYYNNPETTAAEFSDGAWKSGDLGYIDEDGYLYIVDRLKDMIISGGFNVYAVEVEAALASHPAVMMCAVVGIPHQEWGEAVHAEVVLRPGALVEAAELIAHAKEKLGSYKAPKSIVFVEQLPTSVVGKVLRRVVKDRYWQNMQRKVS